MRPCGATRAGTQAPPLPISTIFFHATLHKQNNHLRAICPNATNHSMHNLPKRNRRGGACVPARTSAQRRFHTGNWFCASHIMPRGRERWMRPCGATRAGTQAPPLPISIKHCGVPLYIVHSIAHANRTVYHYPIGVILSIAQGWQVQCSLPWVMM